MTILRFDKSSAAASAIGFDPENGILFASQQHRRQHKRDLSSIHPAKARLGIPSIFASSAIQLRLR